MSSLLARPELASQPLLLVMLAIYDAEANALQDDRHALERGELYERLLRSFAEREVRKAGSALPDAEIGQAVEEELLRLSVVAFAMFIRGRQWVTAAELDSDLHALFAPRDESRRLQSGMRAPLSASETVIGRFFFVHEARAVRDDEQLRTYEFLHATFAEYFIGRLVANEVTDIVVAAQFSASRIRPVDDSFLHALLSFVALTARSSVVSFLAERLEKMSVTHRNALSELLLSLFRDALQQRHDGPFDHYQPAAVTVPARHAAYSANLLLLIVLISGEVTARKLYPGGTDPVSRWRRTALLWRSQLTPEGWSGLVHTLDVSREWDRHQRELRIRFGGDSTPTPHVDPYWSYDRDPGSSYRVSQSRWHRYGFEDLRRHSYFICDEADDTVFHALDPFATELDPRVGTFHSMGEDRAVSSVNALIGLWLTAGRPTASTEELVHAHETCLDIALRTAYFAVKIEAAAQREFCELTLRQLVADRDRLPPLWLSTILNRIESICRESLEISSISDKILGQTLRSYKRVQVSGLSEGEISDALERYVPSEQFEQASQDLQVKRVVTLFGIAGTNKRSTAIILLRQVTPEVLMLPPEISLDDLAAYHYRRGCGYAIIDWQNGLPPASGEAWWNRMRERVGAADAYLIITITDSRDVISHFRWE